MEGTEMSELCNSKSHFSTLLISDLILICSFILSHPLYFFYFIFFAPYLLKLVSFLSPLFITTSLISLAFFTGSVLEKLRFNKDYQSDGLQSLDDLGIYEILFGSSVMEVRESPVEFSEEKQGEDSLQFSDKEDLCVEKIEDSADNKVEINSIPGDKLQHPSPKMEEKRLENFLKILDEFERMSSNVEGKKKLQPLSGAKIDKVVEKSKAEKLFRNGSEATCNRTNDAVNGGKEHTSVVKAHSQRITSKVDHVGEEEEVDRKSTLKAESSRALMEVSSYGSMRKEKEWKRTLACKLFEERHNVDGGDGMDSLWEAYEMDSNKTITNEGEKKKMKKNNQKNIGIHEKYEEEEEIEGQLCCLQALKLSAGKMNLGMGRPNLVKISKAIKGFGWLHHVGKHSKKVHNNNGDRY